MQIQRTDQKGGSVTIPLRRPAGQIKKLAFRLSPKLRRRLRPGLPPTPTQCKKGGSAQVIAPHPPIVASTEHETKDLPASNSTTARDVAPHKEVGAAVVPICQAETRRECNSLILQGDYWEVTYARKTSILEDTRGLRYIAILVRQAGQGSIYASELVAIAQGNPSAGVELKAREPVLDAAGENRLIKRLEDIGFERNSAVAQSNYEHVAELDEEVDRITDQLQKARVPHKGGGRATFDDSAERARKAVSKAISETISKMMGYPNLELLAHHLSTAIQKGQWLSYNGDSQWDVRFQLPMQEKPRLRNSSPGTRKVAAATAGNSK